MLGGVCDFKFAEQELKQMRSTLLGDNNNDDAKGGKNYMKHCSLIIVVNGSPLIDNAGKCIKLLRRREAEGLPSWLAG